MKTIAYRDLSGGSLLEWRKDYNGQQPIEREKSAGRREAALSELRHVGNIAIYLVNGRKLRLISKHGL